MALAVGGRFEHLLELADFDPMRASSNRVEFSGWQGVRNAPCFRLVTAWVWPFEVRNEPLMRTLRAVAILIGRDQLPSSEVVAPLIGVLPRNAQRYLRMLHRDGAFRRDEEGVYHLALSSEQSLWVWRTEIARTCGRLTSINKEREATSSG